MSSGQGHPPPAPGGGVPRRPGAAARAVGGDLPEGVHRGRPRDAGDRHRRQPAAGGLRRQGARRHRGRRARGRGRAPRARRSSWRSSRSTSTRSRPTSPPACCPRRCSASGSSPSSCRRTRSQERLADGDVIGQDRSENAIELQRVIDDTLPLLQAVAAARTSRSPWARSPTRCAAGGTTWVRTSPRPASTSGRSTRCCRSCRPTSRGLADFADTYDGAADDLLAVLDNLAVTNTTIVDQEEQLRRTFTRRDELGEHDRPGSWRPTSGTSSRSRRRPGRSSACSPSTRRSTRACSRG